MHNVTWYLYPYMYYDIRILNYTNEIYNWNQAGKNNNIALSDIPSCSHHWWLSFVAHVGFNTLRPRQNRRHFADNIFKSIFFNENVWIPFQISLKFVPKGPINNIPASVQIMAWRRPGDKPLSEPMMVRLPTHRCVTRHQWVNTSNMYRMDRIPYKGTLAYSDAVHRWGISFHNKMLRLFSQWLIFTT